MSSTRRGGERAASDYYVTPVDEISKFLRAWHEDCLPAFIDCRRILDPCAGGTRDVGGNVIVPMSYPAAIHANARLFPEGYISTIDIRPDSAAVFIANYLAGTCGQTPDLIISNPPFALATEFILKALRDVKPGGYVAFLLRLNFFGGTTEKPKLWAKVGLPVRAYVHAQRMGFNRHRLDLPVKVRNGTDSIEYAHMIWQAGTKATETILKVI